MGCGEAGPGWEALQALMVAAGQAGGAAAQWARRFPAVLEPTLRCAAEDDVCPCTAVTRRSL